VDALTAGGRAAARLLEEKSAIARAATDRLYAERPQLLERYGAVGRERCLEDLHFTLDHLIPAVDLGKREMFVDYARWLDGLLRARAVPTTDVVRSLELIEQEAHARLPDDQSAAVGAILRAGCLALRGAEGV
jgi:hypothetical protein